MMGVARPEVICSHPISCTKTPIYLVEYEYVYVKKCKIQRKEIVFDTATNKDTVSNMQSGKLASFHTSSLSSQFILYLCIYNVYRFAG